MTSREVWASAARSIGIFPTNLTPMLAKGLGLSQDHGILIEDILPDSAATQAELRVGEILTTLSSSFAIGGSWQFIGSGRSEGGGHSVLREPGEAGFAGQPEGVYEWFEAG